jgi:N6-adenosine-specific RNA methylase IME4
LVGVWITNKKSFRELLLGEDGERGLFAEWGVELVEEWVWLKITENGEPMSPVDGTWRKPYEILLVGRNISNVEIRTDSCEVAPQSELDEISGTGRGKEVGISEDEPMPVKRRVIIAVPDMHSRKPNLVAVFAPLLPRYPAPPRCLEIFARNLTADSWAWGNEVLKFQRLEHWTTECADTKQVAGDIEECVVPV